MAKPCILKSAFLLGELLIEKKSQFIKFLKLAFILCFEWENINLKQYSLLTFKYICRNMYIFQKIHISIVYMCIYTMASLLVCWSRTCQWKRLQIEQLQLYFSNYNYISPLTTTIKKPRWCDNCQHIWAFILLIFYAKTISSNCFCIKNI